MTLTSRALAQVSERRALGEFGSSVPPTNAEAGGFGSAAGIAVREDSALQIAAVYGCVNLISSSIATLPIRLVNNKHLGQAKDLRPSLLLSEPCSDMSLFDFVVQFVSSLALRGNFFGRIISRDKNGFASQIKPIPADNAQVRRQPNGEIEYQFFGEKIPNRDVYHVKYLSTPGMLTGVNPIQSLRLAFGLSLAQQSYGAAFFRNSANPQGVIQVKGDLSPDATKAMLKSWLSAHQGINQSNLPAILTGDAEFKPITITPQDSQFLESRGFSAEEISGTIFRVPPHMIGLNEKVSSWGRGIEQMEKGYTLNTLGDYIGRFEQSMTALHPPGQYVRFDLSHRLRGDTLERANASSLMLLAGGWTPNDARSLFDMPALPDGDKLNSPINTELLEKAMAEAEKAVAEKNEPKPEPPPFPPQGLEQPPAVPQK